MIRTARYGAEYALKLQRDPLAAIFEAMDDPYLRSRREDMDHVIGNGCGGTVIGDQLFITSARR